jgi:hypothetical protein
MAIDRRLIGEAAAKFLDDLDAKYGDQGSLGAVMLIVAVDNNDQDDTVEFRGYDGHGVGLAAWKAKGLLTLLNESIGP